MGIGKLHKCPNRVVFIQISKGIFVISYSGAGFFYPIPTPSPSNIVGDSPSSSSIPGQIGKFSIWLGRVGLNPCEDMDFCHPYNYLRVFLLFSIRGRKFKDWNLLPIPVPSPSNTIEDFRPLFPMKSEIFGFNRSDPVRGAVIFAIRPGSRNNNKFFFLNKLNRILIW